MYTQFFGNYLLNQKLVTPAQLAEAIEIKSATRLKLGVLAINAGYMTASQVDEVHKAQQKIDKRFGDIAVDLGYLNADQVNELLASQKTGYLLLGQALVDKGYLSNADFENAINEYKNKYKLSDNDKFNDANESISPIVSEFYHFGNLSNAKTLTRYVTLLLKNLIRFIGDDFTPLEATVINNFKCEVITSQSIVGSFSAYTAIEAREDIFAKFASRYAQEEITTADDYASAVVGEFLNLNNGLFTVNMSNENNIELELEPQNTEKNKVLTFLSSAFRIPIVFPFGTVNFIIVNSDLSNN